MIFEDVYQHPDGINELYDMLKERSTEDDKTINISHRALPSLDEHIAFVQSRPYRHWFFIVTGTGIAGYISATENNEVGIMLRIAHRNQGHGTAALKIFLATCDPLPAIPGKRGGKWIANINPLNERSRHVFAKLGFTIKQLTYELP